MSPRSIEEYAQTIRPRYRAAPRHVRGRILTEFCRVTGYHRKSAIRLLHRHPQLRKHAGGRPRRYGPDVARPLRELWEISDHLCSKRLAPFLPELVRVLEHSGELRLAPTARSALAAVSAATIDRLLKPHRLPGPRRPHTGAPSTAALRATVPVRTFGEWQGVSPGAVQADLVAHCGESPAGFYLTSLVAVDVATSWTECQAVWGKGYKRVGTAVHLVRQHLPFVLRELHTDNVLTRMSRAQSSLPALGCRALRFPRAPGDFHRTKEDAFTIVTQGPAARAFPVPKTTSAPGGRSEHCLRGRHVSPRRPY